MTVPVGWWARDTPLHLADGCAFRSKRRKHRPILITTEQRTRHLLCEGRSGIGKSRFARNLIIQDIDANRGFTLIDAQDLQAEILHEMAFRAFPEQREPTPEQLENLGDKLVIIEPADQRFGIPGINLLQTPPGHIGFTAVDAILEVLKELWRDNWGPRLEDIARNALLLLQEQGLTPLEMLPFLSDIVFRNAVVARCRNPDVRIYFQEHLHGVGEREMRSWVESPRNKFSAFFAHPLVRPILGQARSTIDFRDILDNGKWLIIAISRDRMKESRKLFGALMVALLHQAAIGREHTPPERRTFHCLYCDEFQQYFSETFLHILEGSRKYNLGLALFHQNLTQPPLDRNPAYIDTILGNVSTLCTFAVGRKDAVRLSQEMFYTSGTEVKHQRRFLGIPLEKASYWSRGDEKENYAAELMKQRRAELFIKLKGTGQDEPFYARVPEQPDLRIDRERIDWLRRHVAGRYYRPLADVQREITQRWAAIRGGLDGMRPRPQDFTR